MKTLTFGLSVSLITLFGCTTTPVKDEWAQGIPGKSGYLTVNPGFEEKKGYSVGSDFNRCEPVTFRNVIYQPGTVFYFLEIEQLGKKFLANSLGRKTLFSYVYDKPAEIGNLIHKSLETKFPLEKRMVKTETGSKENVELICSGKIWIGMLEKELYFVLGYPDKINRTMSERGEQSQLVYKRSEIESNFYYVRGGILTSWQD